MYSFYLCFFTRFPGVFQHENYPVEFPLPSNLPSFESLPAIKPLIFKPLSTEEPIGNTSEFILTVGGFKTEFEALKVGRLMADSLLILGAKWGIGINTKNDQTNKNKSPEYVEELQKLGVSQELPGLSVFPDDKQPTFIAIGQPNVLEQRTTQDFGTELLTILSKNPQVSDKDRLALELYAASHYEYSIHAQFIILVTALEGILEPQQRSSDVIEVVNQLKKTVKKELEMDKTTKESMLNYLGEIKKESINKGLQRLANTYLHDKTYCGLPANEFIKECYDVRSTLLHDGLIKQTNIKIKTRTEKLNIFVADLLIKKLLETIS